MNRHTLPRTPTCEMTAFGAVPSTARLRFDAVGGGVPQGQCGDESCSVRSGAGEVERHSLGVGRNLAGDDAACVAGERLMRDAVIDAAWSAVTGEAWIENGPMLFDERADAAVLVDGESLDFPSAEVAAKRIRKIRDDITLDCPDPIGSLERNAAMQAARADFRAALQR